MDITDQQAALALRTYLEAVTPILDFRVFGSRARGENQADSDLDVFIKVPVLDRALRDKIHELAWEVGFQYDRVISAFVVTEAQVQEGTVRGKLLQCHQTDQQGVSDLPSSTPWAW